METIKVNMNPNPLDVQTIHASQNDGEARQWGFKLHNNGDVIDSSEVTDQMVFKAYKGGTEQLLPENTSTPTTSPFKGDIRYPQGLLTDQEFTYRESPTEEDGLAKITDIKGNTLVWNQLINATDGSGTIGEGVTYTTSNGVITLNGTPTSAGSLVIGGAFSAKANHKYLLKGCPSGGGDTTYQLFVSRSSVAFPQGNRLQDTGNGKIATALGDENNLELRLYVYSSSPTFSNTKFIPQIFDLTAMGLDSLTNAEILQWFADYFPLSYYSYNQGSLLSFNGNGIKTVGKNQFDKNTAQSGKTINASGQVVNGGHYVSAYIPILPNTNYYLSNVVSARNGRSGFTYDGSLNPISVITISGQASSESGIFTAPSNARYMVLSTDTPDICQLEFGTSATSYEPYTSSTLSLPISTYFPNGMKSAGNVYDELTESKAITRIGNVTFDGTQTVAGSNFSSTQCRMFINVPNVKPFTPFTSGDVDNGIISSYLQNTSNDATFNGAKGIHRRINGASQICVSLGTDGYASGITTETLFNQYLASHPLTVYYELETPTETSFTTASLVTENAEIPLSNNDGVLLGKCTEELSENPGFIDAKIKLSDSDGECYSNKIQLHVERKPS